MGGGGGVWNSNLLQRYWTVLCDYPAWMIPAAIRVSMFAFTRASCHMFHFYFFYLYSFCVVESRCFFSHARSAMCLIFFFMSLEPRCLLSHARPAI